ncbi:hypothetical protein D3C72_2012060 [compost metagenome]
MLRDVRARAHQAHTPEQYINELREFIDTATAKESPHAGDAGVIGLCEIRADAGGTLNHAAKLKHTKLAPAQPQAVLTKKYRKTRLQSNRRGSH